MAAKCKPVSVNVKRGISGGWAGGSTQKAESVTSHRTRSNFWLTSVAVQDWIKQGRFFKTIRNPRCLMNSNDVFVWRNLTQLVTLKGGFVTMLRIQPLADTSWMTQKSQKSIYLNMQSMPCEKPTHACKNKRIRVHTVQHHLFSFPKKFGGLSFKAQNRRLGQRHWNVGVFPRVSD